ncbi:LOW QUALITY PROTEIN: CD226 antigen [Pterocles gutturalis]
MELLSLLRDPISSAPGSSSQHLHANVEGKFVDSTVKLTENVKLECIYPKKAVIIQTFWMKLNVTHKENLAVLHPIYSIHIEDKYNGRIYFESASRQDKSLSFFKSTLEDIGLYFCSIVTSPDIWEKVTEIIQPGKCFEVSQKQNNHVFTKPGGRCRFTCPKSEESVQQVMWERINADWVDTGVLCSLSEKQSLVQFKECRLVDCSNQTNPVIVIENITASDFATYHCVATGRKTYVMSLLWLKESHLSLSDLIIGLQTRCWLVFSCFDLRAQCVLILPHMAGLKFRSGKTEANFTASALSLRTLSQDLKPANSYGRYNFHGTQKTERRGEESSLGQTEEMYVNCKNISHKPKERPIDSFLRMKQSKHRPCVQLRFYSLCTGEMWKIKLVALGTAWAGLAGQPAWARLHQGLGAGIMSLPKDQLLVPLVCLEGASTA